MGSALSGPVDDVPCVASDAAGEHSEFGCQLRFCTYNIFEGLDGREPRRIELCQQWVRSQRLDLVGLNEVNDFTADSLSEFARCCGLNHSFLREARTGYHLGIMSRCPFVVADTSHLQLHHGLLHAKAQLGDETLHVFVTHLTPFEAMARRKEVQAIIDYAEKLHSEPLVLMGDLNSLSSADAAVHRHAQLLEEVLLAQPKLRKKFLDAKKHVDYEPVEMLYRAGFVDPGRAVGAADSTTVPTSVNVDDAHATRMRLDYVMLGPGLAQRAHGARAITARDRFTDCISDHFPVLLAATI